MSKNIENFCGFNWQLWRHRNEIWRHYLCTTWRSKLHYFKQN